MKNEDLISKSKLYDEAVRLSGPFTGDGWDNWGVYNLIMRQPPVDAVPVVRCQNCGLRGTNECPMTFCEWPDFDVIVVDRTVDNGFCDRGKEKHNA